MFHVYPSFCDKIWDKKTVQKGAVDKLLQISNGSQAVIVLGHFRPCGFAPLPFDKFAYIADIYFSGHSFAFLMGLIDYDLIRCSGCFIFQ
jgi:hypothetical protein